jgi:hypothetical protein
MMMFNLTSGMFGLVSKTAAVSYRQNLTGSIF